MKDKEKVYCSGMGLGGWLTLLFVGLKLTGHITWSWGWVLSPLWIPLVVIATAVFITILICGLATVCREIKDKL